MRKSTKQKNNRNTNIEAIGWIGVLLILGAYFAHSFKFISSETITYSAANLLGAILLIIHAAVKRDTEIAILNGVWAIVALIAIINLVI